MITEDWVVVNISLISSGLGSSSEHSSNTSSSSPSMFGFLAMMLITSGLDPRSPRLFFFALAAMITVAT